MMAGPVVLTLALFCAVLSVESVGTLDVALLTMPPSRATAKKSTSGMVPNAYFSSLLFPQQTHCLKTKQRDTGLARGKANQHQFVKPRHCRVLVKNELRVF